MPAIDETLNQPQPLTEYNLFSSDRVLREAVAREGTAWACAIGRVRPPGGERGGHAMRRACERIPAGAAHA